jgi:hypothetical protein
MKLRTLSLVVTIAAFAGTGEVYADAIFLSDGRFIAIDMDGHSGLPLPPAEFHLHQTSVPSPSYSDFDASFRESRLAFGASSQNSQLSGLNFASSNATRAGIGGDSWVWQVSMKSVFDIVFELTSFYEFQTLAQVFTQNDGTCFFPPQCPSTGFARTLYQLTGPSGDVFRYIGPIWTIPGHPDIFQSSGLLPPGTYRLYGESITSGGTYKTETYRGEANLDFSMSLTPVPEGEFPLWPLVFPMSILLLWSRNDHRLESFASSGMKRRS